ncbi:MAG: ubiquinone/menaquinone biosynthesis methyltransferase [Alphaproteobacteria bacterium]|nr:ubiquinone/menaquinone biosynthesis methyltransferase [Alphaproteobacteria bacterium]
MNETKEHTESFGFREVGAGEKARLVRGVFTSVAARYDLMNDLMSAGIHRAWKSTLLTRVNPQPGERLIDVAGGTGDIAAGFLKRADRRASRGRPAATAIVCDINEEMLRAGAARHGHASHTDRLARLCGDAERLPLKDKSADVYTIAFGIRNVTDIAAALGEAHRVLKLGGRFYCLEFSHPVTQGLQSVYDAYSFNVIPRLGEWVAKDRGSYQYLVESIRRFPTQDAFAAMIARAGFARVKYENLTAGIAAIHSGWRL